jgi:putative transposase
VHAQATGSTAPQTWKTFLRNHLVGTIAIDFLTVPTVTFDIVYLFFVLSLERRRVLHVNVTAHPNAAWTAHQIVEAIGMEVVPSRLVRDRDAIFGTVFDARVENLGIRQLPPSAGDVVALPRVGGLHHRYSRAA